MSGTRAISTTCRRELSKFFSPARLGAEGNSRHSDRNISLFPSWSGLRTYQFPCIRTSNYINYIHHRLRRTDLLLHVLTLTHLCLFIIRRWSLESRRWKGSTEKLRNGRGPHDAKHRPAPYRRWAVQFFLTAYTWVYSLCSIIPQFWRSTYRFLISCGCTSALWRPITQFVNHQPITQ